MSRLNLILASSSIYRKELLTKHLLPVEQIEPEVDETLIPLEKPRARSIRLGKEKAESILESIASLKPWLVLASDQVCHMNGNIYRKPGSAETASKHLAEFSGRWVTFSTSLVLVDHKNRHFNIIEDYQLQFRELSKVDIDEYIKEDEPFDCAGAIKLESFGLSLIQSATGRDINSVYGLPLVALFEGLRKLGYPIFNLK